MNRLVITGLVEELKEGGQSGKYQYQISNLGIAAMQVAVLSQTQQDANARGCSGTSPAFNASLGRCFKPDLQSDNTDNADNADESDEDDEEENDVSSFLWPQVHFVWLLQSLVRLGLTLLFPKSFFQHLIHGISPIRAFSSSLKKRLFAIQPLWYSNSANLLQ